jgi:3-dehydrotetronate 4-kinase
MSSLLFAAVADDDTGASDLAGMLADQGVRPLLVLDPAFLAGDHPQLTQAQAIVLATATRALPRQRAFDVTLEAVRCAASLHPRIIQIKYCSTFDSTGEGNIGPSLDAALEVLAEDFTIAVPALPVNGRTTYCGYHFVKGQLLSDSPMRHHPLTPMTNPNLVDHLQRQTSRTVGLTPHGVVASGAGAIARQWAELRAGSTSIAVVDCIDEAQAAAIAEAACELKLVSGSSLFGTHLPAAWRRRGWLAPPAGALWEGLDRTPGRGRLVVAGSCSVATAAQNVWLASHGALVIELDARDLLESGPGSAAGQAVRELADRGTVLLKTRSSRDEIAAAQAWGASQGWSPAELGLRISAALASVVRDIVAEQVPEVLVCAGGETTGAICRAVAIRAFAVGRNIQPGVPVCFPLEGPRIPMALKSGNFGSEDFYGAAFAAAV